jgi:hypothetical protein
MGGGARDQMGQSALVMGGQVLEEDEGEPGVIGQVREELGEGLQPAGGGAHPDNGEWGALARGNLFLGGLGGLWLRLVRVRARDLGLAPAHGLILGCVVLLWPGFILGPVPFGRHTAPPPLMPCSTARVRFGFGPKSCPSLGFSYHKPTGSLASAASWKRVAIGGALGGSAGGGTNRAGGAVVSWPSYPDAGRFGATVGSMFGLRRKRFIGSYLFFRATRRL